MQEWSDPPSSRFKATFINQVKPNHNADRMTYCFITGVMYGITVKHVCAADTCAQSLSVSVCGPDGVLHLLISSQSYVPC